MLGENCMGRKIFFALCIMLTGLLIACGENEEVTGTIETDSMVTDSKIEATLGNEIEDAAVETEQSWVNHYYNRGLYEENGFLYRQFSDGLYRRAKGTDSWEVLCYIPMKNASGLTGYGNMLYFTGAHEEETQDVSWNNSVFCYNLNTGEYGEILTGEDLIGTLNVYDGCLYVQRFTMEEGYMVYDGYRLDENGNISEQLNPDSADFLCYEQNRYSIAEYELTQGSVAGDRNNRADIGELKEEVIPTPACAAMLGGKVVLRQQKDESSSNFFLRDLNTSEDMLMFEASDILVVMEQGICYFTVDDERLMYYSFDTGEERELPMPEFWKGDNRPMSLSSYVTWSPENLYFFNYEDSLPQIVRISLADGALEVIAEGETLLETDLYRINQVDEEYFYHGEQAYALSD